MRAWVEFFTTPGWICLLSVIAICPWIILSALRGSEIEKPPGDEP